MSEAFAVRVARAREVLTPDRRRVLVAIGA
ncbi:MAG: hypothetical protein QOH73_2589, partial [Gaiellaceae bacterium]|nr:hypothetical protein [Gaiellaceae bacterium]